MLINGAIEAQKKVLALSLAETNPLISIKPRIDLASLYDMLERKEDAMVELEKAITTARAGNMETLLFMALEAKAHLLWMRGRTAEARDAFRAGMAIERDNERILEGAAALAGATTRQD